MKTRQANLHHSAFAVPDLDKTIPLSAADPSDD